MKLFIPGLGTWRFLRALWRGWRRTAPEELSDLQSSTQLAALMARANPFAPWQERANWMMDVVDWLRRAPRARTDGTQRRVRLCLDWLDTHHATHRLVRTTLQKTLREASGPELFSTTGLPHEPAFFSELSDRIARKILPHAPSNKDLSALFITMLRGSAGADWLLSLDPDSLRRLWSLAADSGVAHAYRKQIDEALTYLVTLVLAVGISPEFRQRLDCKLPLQALPFMALRREMEKYLLLGSHDAASLRSVRMLVAVCRAQTDKIYAHLDEHGVSLSLVYQVERMRAQLARISKLIDLRAAADSGADDVQLQAQTLLGELVVAHRHRSSIGRLIQRSFSLVARKMVERHAQHGELYRVTSRLEYRAVLKAAAIGGVLIGLTMSGRLLLPAVSLAGFFQGALVSGGYMLVFLLIAAFGGLLAAQQPAVAAPALAARIGALDTPFEMNAVQTEASGLLRVQSAALIGNLALLIPLILLLASGLFWLNGRHLLTADMALQRLQQLSLFGFGPLFAVWTGVLLWVAGLAAGFADNWFALRQMRQALAQHRGLVRGLGGERAAVFADWLERNLARIAGAIALGLLFGMTPVVAQFFGLTLDIRHVSFAAASLAAAAASLGWTVLLTAQFWLALAGVLAIGILNIGVAFAGALALALSARGISTQRRWQVARSLLRELVTNVHFSLWPATRLAPVHSAAPDQRAPEEPDQRSHAQH